MDNSTKERLKEIINDKQTKRDVTFFRDVIDIYNKDSLIDGRIKLVESYEYGRLSVDVATYELFADFNTYKDRMYKYAANAPFNGLSLDEASDYYFILFIFHEVEHIKQAIYGNEKKHEYKVINDLYELIYGLFLKANTFKLNRYYNDAARYSFERNANMEACLILYELFDDSFFKDAAKVDYFLNAMHGYTTIINDRVICPAEDTLRKLGRLVKMDKKEEIPFELAFNHGLFVEPSIIDNFFNDYLFSDELESIDFDSYKRRIRSL